MIKKLFLAVLVLLCCSCAHRILVNSPAAAKEKLFFDQGLKALSKNDYKQSYEKFTNLLREFPTTKWLPNTYFNVGVSLEGLGRFQEASDSYQKVIEFYEGIATHEEAASLYRLSLCQEELGQDDKMLLALLQLENHAYNLEKDQAEVEIPARIAAGYARLGNLEQAKIYFSKSEAGLKKIRRAHPKGESLSWLPKTLYSIGHIPPMPKDQSEPLFKNELASIDQAQERLLQAAEAGRGPWSLKASQELIAIYKNIWDRIDNLEIPQGTDALLQAKEKQNRQRRMSAELDGIIDHLKLLRIPPSPQEPELPHVTEIFKTVLNIEMKSSQVAFLPDIQDQNTPESQKRESLKKEGKILIKK